MKLGLNIKFICYTVFIVVFISLVFAAVFIYQSRKALLHEFDTRAESLVRNLALNIEVPLLIENTRALSSLAENLLKEKDVQRVVISGQDGTTFVSMDKGTRLLFWQRHTVTRPVYFTPESSEGITENMTSFVGEEPRAQETGPLRQGQAIGTIEVLFSRNAIVEALNRIRWWIFFAATIAAFIGGLAALYFSHSLIIPIQRLAQATYSIARGNWEERLTVARSDELGQLTESFNIMVASLIAKKEQLENTYKELARKEKMAETGKFSMIIAHELKNPLSIIKGSVDILAKKTTDPEICSTMVAYIQEEVVRLNKLIDDFLSFARPAPPRKVTTDINAIVRSLSEHFRFLENSGKAVTLHPELQDVPGIPADQDQIRQVLLNLINNAVQAINTAGDIFIRTDFSNGTLCIRVRDTGPGIPKDMQDKLFEPFITTKAKGTGLGLAIVKKFVENHQGSITIESGPNGGTEVTLLLPADIS